MKTKPNSAPYRKNDLFRGDPANTSLNACVGQNGGPYDFLDYARGYALAARTMSYDEKLLLFSVDIVVYPIVYCYRHAVELYLKHLAQELAKLRPSGDGVALTHELIDNWDKVKGQIVKEPGINEDPFLVEQVDTVLRDFVEVDRAAVTFRFPQGKDGNPTLQDVSLINIGVLRETLNEVCNIFDCWSEEIDSML